MRMNNVKGKLGFALLAVLGTTCALGLAGCDKEKKSKITWAGRIFDVKYDAAGRINVPAPVAKGTQCLYNFWLKRKDQPANQWPVARAGWLDIDDHGEFELKQEVAAKDIIAKPDGSLMDPGAVTFVAALFLNCGNSEYSPIRTIEFSTHSSHIKVASDLSKVELKRESWSDVRDRLARLLPVLRTEQGADAKLTALFAADASVGSLYRMSE